MEKTAKLGDAPHLMFFSYNIYFFNIGYPTFNGLSMCPIQTIIYGYMTSKKIEEVSRKHSCISWCFCSFFGGIYIYKYNKYGVYKYTHTIPEKGH